MIEETLVAMLKDGTICPQVTALTSHVRPYTDTNITALPAITFWRQDTARPFSNDGPTGQRLARFEIDAWAADYRTAAAVLDAIRYSLDGWSGTYQGIRIDSIHVEDQGDQTQTPVVPGAQKPTQRSTIYLRISYQG